MLLHKRLHWRLSSPSLHANLTCSTTSSAFACNTTWLTSKFKQRDLCIHISRMFSMPLGAAVHILLHYGAKSPLLKAESSLLESLRMSWQHAVRDSKLPCHGSLQNLASPHFGYYLGTRWQQERLTNPFRPFFKHSGHGTITSATQGSHLLHSSSRYGFGKLAVGNAHPCLVTQLLFPHSVVSCVGEAGKSTGEQMRAYAAWTFG